MASGSICKQDRKKNAVANSLKEDTSAIPSCFAKPCNPEVLLGGHHAVTEADVCVWPPVLVGKWDTSRLKELPVGYRSIDASCLRKFIGDELETIARAWKGTHITGDINTSLSSISEGNKNRPLYVFTETVEGYLAARHIDRVWSKECVASYKCRLKISGWTLSYATVRDMAGIDPHKKFVHWTPLCGSTEDDLRSLSSKEKNAEINKTDTSQCPSSPPLFYSEDLKRRIREIKDAELYFQQSIAEEEHYEDTDNRYSLKLKAVLKENFMKPIEVFLAEVCQRELELRNLFTYDGAHVAKTATERLESLGVMMSEGNAGKTFTSRMINRGVELELHTLDSVAKEIRKASTNQRTLKNVEIEQIKSIQILIEKQKTEMLKLLMKYSAQSQFILKGEMESRLKLVKSVRRTEEEVSVLTKFLSVGTIEIVEQIQKDTLEDQEKKLKFANNELVIQIGHHAWDRENQEQKLKIANEELTAHKNELAILSATLISLKDMKESKPNQECCICYHELQGFSVPSDQGESSSAKKVYKRACFLPCMHANVCSTCSDKRWSEGPRLCPICRQKLTMKPRIIYL